MRCKYCGGKCDSKICSNCCAKLNLIRKIKKMLDEVKKNDKK